MPQVQLAYGTFSAMLPWRAGADKRVLAKVCMMGPIASRAFLRRLRPLVPRSFTLLDIHRRGTIVVRMTHKIVRRRAMRMLLLLLGVLLSASNAAAQEAPPPDKARVRQLIDKLGDD